MRQDRRLTVRQLASLIPDISKTFKIHEIFKEKSRCWNACVRRVREMLHKDQKRQRVVASREFFERYAQ